MQYSGIIACAVVVLLQPACLPVHGVTVALLLRTCVCACVCTVDLYSYVTRPAFVYVHLRMLHDRMLMLSRDPPVLNRSRPLCVPFTLVTIAFSCHADTFQHDISLGKLIKHLQS